jgi:hypothetical protein
MWPAGLGLLSFRELPWGSRTDPSTWTPHDGHQGASQGHAAPARTTHG